MNLLEERNIAYEYAEQIEQYLNNNKFYSAEESGIDSIPTMGVYIITFRVDGDKKRDHLKFDNLAKEWAKKSGKKIWKIDTEETGSRGSGSFEADHIIYIVENDEAIKKIINFSRMFVGESLKSALKNNRFRNKNNAKLNEDINKEYRKSIVEIFDRVF